MASLWKFRTFKYVLFMVLVSNSRANDVSASKQTAASTEAINNKKFMPSYKVLFRRSDGELLLPSLPASVAPFLEALQTSESNNLNTYEEAKPTYGPQPAENLPTCLLRTCDQYVTGRDLTYERALQIVQNEEYLVAVDADLIRRRSDLGFGASNQVAQWSLPLHDHLTQYVATLGRKKRNSEKNLKDKEEIELKEIEETVRKARLFNFTTVSYNSADLTQQYLRYGVAGGLLLALAAYLPAPEEPLLPIDLPKISSKIDNVETVEESVKQNYQENYNPWEDKVISKRQGLLDRLLPFRRKRPPPREVRPKRIPEAKIPRPGTPTLSQKRPAPIAKTPAVAEEEPVLEPALKDESDNRLEFSDGKNPLLSDSDFQKFFPSWSRKKRATLIQESRLFNLTGSGFGTVTYPWTDVIGTYINYAVAGGLILALTSLLPDKTQDVAVPFELPKLELPSIPDFPIQSKLNTINLPPNVPEGYVPPGNPLPGTPGGGAKPLGLTPEASEALALIPQGSIPVAVFPGYVSPRTVPAVSVIFLETPTPSLVKRQGNVWPWDNKDYSGGYATDYSHLRYGFRTRVSLVENQSCILDVTCTATGDRIDVALAKRRSYNLGFSSFGSRLSRRQALEEFSSDAPPDCRAIRDPSNSCLGYSK